MYLTSMTHEELYAEVRKDLIEISTKINMFMDRVRKKTKSMMPFPVPTQHDHHHHPKKCVDSSGKIQLIYARGRISGLRSHYRHFKQWLYPNDEFQIPRYSDALHSTFHATIQRALHRPLSNRLQRGKLIRVLCV